MQHVDHLLSAYIDKELKEQKRLVVEKHLQTCTDCLELYEDFSWMSHELVNTYKQITLPNHLTNQVMAAIDQEEAQNRQKEISPILSYTTLRWGTISSIFLLLSVNLSLILAFGVLFSFTPIRIFYHLIHGLLTIFSAIPYLSVAISLMSLLLIVFSLWTLRHLLSSKKVEMI
jgi:anti-sigma factor RsiW